MDARLAVLEEEVGSLRRQLKVRDADVDELRRDLRALAKRVEPVLPKAAPTSYSLLDTVDKYRQRFVRGGENRRVKVCLNGTWVTLTKPPDFKTSASHPEFSGARGTLVAEEKSVVTVATKSVHELPFQLLAGDLLCWEFTVEEKGADVGFSLKKRDASDAGALQITEVTLPWEGMHTTGGAAKQPAPGIAPVTPLRYGPVCRGVWGAALQACEVVFCWDNSYSTWTKKTISYSIRVFSEDGALREAATVSRGGAGAAAAPAAAAAAAPAAAAPTKGGAAVGGGGAGGGAAEVEEEGTASTPPPAPAAQGSSEAS